MIHARPTALIIQKCACDPMSSVSVCLATDALRLTAKSRRTRVSSLNSVAIKKSRCFAEEVSSLHDHHISHHIRRPTPNILEFRHQLVSIHRTPKFALHFVKGLVGGVLHCPIGHLSQNCTFSRMVDHDNFIVDLLSLFHKFSNDSSRFSLEDALTVTSSIQRLQDAGETERICHATEILAKIVFRLRDTRNVICRSKVICALLDFSTKNYASGHSFPVQHWEIVTSLITFADTDMCAHWRCCDSSLQSIFSLCECVSRFEDVSLQRCSLDIIIFLSRRNLYMSSTYKWSDFSPAFLSRAKWHECFHILGLCNGIVCEGCSPPSEILLRKILHEMPVSEEERLLSRLATEGNDMNGVWLSRDWTYRNVLAFASLLRSKKWELCRANLLDLKIAGSERQRSILNPLFGRALQLNGLYSEAYTVFLESIKDPAASKYYIRKSENNRALGTILSHSLMENCLGSGLWSEGLQIHNAMVEFDDKKDPVYVNDPQSMYLSGAILSKLTSMTTITHVYSSVSKLLQSNTPSWAQATMLFDLEARSSPDVLLFFQQNGLSPAISDLTNALDFSYQKVGKLSPLPKQNPPLLMCTTSPQDRPLARRTAMRRDDRSLVAFQLLSDAQRFSFRPSQATLNKTMVGAQCYEWSRAILVLKQSLFTSRKDSPGNSTFIKNITQSLLGASQWMLAAKVYTMLARSDEVAKDGSSVHDIVMTCLVLEQAWDRAIQYFYRLLMAGTAPNLSSTTIDAALEACLHASTFMSDLARDVKCIAASLEDIVHIGCSLSQHVQRVITKVTSPDCEIIVRRNLYQM